MAMDSMSECRASEVFEAQAFLYRVMYGFKTPMTVKWAIDLGIPNIIHNHGQPITLSDLVSLLEVPQTKVSCVQRLLRLLAHLGFFAIIKIDDNNEAYALTPTSRLLVSGSDHCLSSMVNLLSTPGIIGAYHQMGKWTFEEDHSIIETAFGRGGFFELFKENPALMKTFNEAMESDSQVVRLALRDCKFVFEGLDSIVDVGGGTGNTAKIICETFPNLKYVVLDTPQVVAGLTGTNNLTFVGGNMFEFIPQADAVLLKWVLHNWSDDDCIKILKNCKDAISGKGEGGKVIIIDIVINEKQDKKEMTETKLLFDIAMMAMLNGKERDEKDWKRLFMEAGFQHYKIFPAFGFRSLIELYP